MRLSCVMREQEKTKADEWRLSNLHAWNALEPTQQSEHKFSIQSSTERHPPPSIRLSIRLTLYPFHRRDCLADFVHLCISSSAERSDLDRS